MLNHLLALHVFENAFWEDFIHHLLSDRGEADQLTAPQTLIPALLRRLEYYLLLQSSGTSPSHDDYLR